MGGFNYTSKWRNLFTFVIDSKQPYHLVTYEDLLRDPIYEMQKIMRFLQVANGFEQNDLEKRLLCLSYNLQGSQKRKKSYDSVDPFHNDFKTKINLAIDEAEKKLTQAGLRVDFSLYKRNLT